MLALALVASAFSAIAAGCSEAVAVKSTAPMLRGVNLAGQRYTIGNQMPVTAAIDYFVAEKKMNIIRLCLDWERLQPSLNGPLTPVEMAGINEQISAIVAGGAKVIIEIHGYGRRTEGGVERIIGETEFVTSDHFSDLWRRFAEAWKNNDNVIFELMNEPHDQKNDILMDVQNAAILAIRSTGAKNLIMVTGNGWSHPEWYADRANQALALRLKDPLDNMAFAIHRYFDQYSQGQSCSVYSTSVSSMKTFTDWARANGKRAFVGEFGVCGTAEGREAVTHFLNHVEANPDVYMGWTWWAGGGWWQDDYIYLLDPYGSQWDKNNPDRNVALGGTGKSTTWAKPRPDRPQMKFIQPYLSAGASPFNGASIPNKR